MNPEAVEQSRETFAQVRWHLDAEVGAYFGALYRRVLAEAVSEEPLRTIGITSFRNGEGVSTVASRLALAAALEGERKVLLVHASPSAATGHGARGVDLTPGLLNVLSGSHQLEQVVQATSLENLSVLPLGTQMADDAEPMRTNLGELLDGATLEHSLVVVDLAPVGALARMAEVTGRLDGIVLVVEADCTRRSHALGGADALSDARVLGVVLNKAIGTQRGSQD